MATASGQGRVVLVSNRGPVQYRREGGRRVASRGSGGLVTALASLGSRFDDAVWVCGAMTDEDLAVAAEHDGGRFAVDVLGPHMALRMVALDPEVQRKFYAVIANPWLWFIQHQLWGLADIPDITREEHDAFERGYAVANARYADAVAEEVEAAGGQATVLVQDYHFYLLPDRVRERCPGVFLHHFVHTPWPQPDSWRVLPPDMREPLLRGLLGNDVVGFHTERYARNFVLCCQELLDLPVDRRELSVEVGERTVLARWYPISVDADAFDRMAASPEVARYEEDLAATRRRHLILRVDRTDPSKNIARGFRAFDVLLRDHAELLGEVTFLALLQPSRQEVPEYAAELERIRRTVADVNLAHGRPDWQPIDLRLEENMDQAVAAYKLFDVLMVNAAYDGMNLVAKEAILVNERDGVLALSENTGAHDELGALAVTLHPFDVQQQADALYEALTMDVEERRARQQACAAIVRHNDVVRWLERQLADARRLAATPPG